MNKDEEEDTSQPKISHKVDHIFGKTTNHLRHRFLQPRFYVAVKRPTSVDGIKNMLSPPPPLLLRDRGSSKRSNLVFSLGAINT